MRRHLAWSGFALGVGIVIWSIIQLFEASRLSEVESLKRQITTQLTVFTDKDNGCQYVAVYPTGITPRMGTDGKQVCQ